jgi:C-terminal processing protease CtpA/Prc
MVGTADGGLRVTSVRAGSPAARAAILPGDIVTSIDGRPVRSSKILLKAGQSKTEVACMAGVSLCSVKRIAEETPAVHVDDAVERAKRRIGRPSAYTASLGEG